MLRYTEFVYFIGDSSNGRTADSESVSRGSNPRSPAKSTMSCMARSSSGQGHRPLKAEITGSNPVRATNFLCIVYRPNICIYTLKRGRTMQRQIPTREQVESYLSDRRNWGRWKDNPAAGTINLVTPKKRIDAAKLVKTGESVSLSNPLPVDSSTANIRPVDFYLKKYQLN